MPRPIKYHPHGSVLFITSRIEQGLFLLANPLAESIILSCLARAQELYPLKISHMVTEQNHLHLIATVENPDDIAAFMGYFKAETAHRFNAILGRQKRTIWCEGYDSPVVLTPTRALIAIAYLYANPAKDNLEDNIDKYPGFSTWSMFTKQQLSRDCDHLPRNAFRALGKNEHTLSAYSAEASRLRAIKRRKVPFVIDPDAWLIAFGIEDPEDRLKWNERLVARVRRLEERARKLRFREAKPVVGRQNLKNRIIDTEYLPKKQSGKRSSCVSDRRILRVEFRCNLRLQVKNGKHIYQRWREGDTSARYPAGLYPPSMPKLIEPICDWNRITTVFES